MTGRPSWPREYPIAYSARVLSVADALRTVVERVPRLGVETVALDETCGRILAANLVASRALPGFDNAAMDGYAARASDLPGTLPVVAVVGAGALPSPPIPTGAAVRIFTGAPVPDELDTVVMQEDATREGDRVTLPGALPGAHIRRAGEDIADGQAVLLAGTRLAPWHMTILAALGIAEVPVARRPRVAIIATGDELVPVDVLPGPGQLVDSSVHALRALVAEAGGVATSLGIAPDDRAAITALLARALDPAHFDAVITTGGVSVGDRDFVHDALADAGVARDLYKVAMKPGKPFAFGRGSDGRPVFGLPGNPVSTIVAFELFLRPALLAMQGAAVRERPRAVVLLPTGYSKPAGRAHYLRARVVRNADKLIAHVYPKQGSAMLSSLVSTNALVEIPAEAHDVPPGGPVRALLLEPV